MIEVKSVTMTSFEDGSVWLTYYQDDNKYGYELRMPKDILNPIREDKIPLNQLETKGLILDVVWSDNDMLYIDEYEDPELYKTSIEAIHNDCEKFPNLKEYFSIEPYDEETSTLVVYSEIVTAVLFDL